MNNKERDHRERTQLASERAAFMRAMGKEGGTSWRDQSRGAAKMPPAAKPLSAKQTREYADPTE